MLSVCDCTSMLVLYLRLINANDFSIKREIYFHIDVIHLHID